jgi:hypothetical protein
VSCDAGLKHHSAEAIENPRETSGLTLMSCAHVVSCAARASLHDEVGFSWFPDNAWASADHHRRARTVEARTIKEHSPSTHGADLRTIHCGACQVKERKSKRQEGSKHGKEESRARQQAVVELRTDKPA